LAQNIQGRALLLALFNTGRYTFFYELATSGHKSELPNLDKKKAVF